MIMDGIILVIFVLTVVICLRRGFAATVVGFLRGIVSVIVAYFLCGWVGDYITSKTQLGTLLENKISGALSQSWENSAIYKAIPSLFKSGSGDLLDDGATKITSIIISILSFIIILLIIRLFLGLVLRLFSTKHRGGVIGFMDRFLGTLLGVVFGAFFVMAFLALIFPILGLVAPSRCEMVLSWFDNSFFAKALYDNNLLLVLYRDFFL